MAIIDVNEQIRKICRKCF